jgi:hypothetical protein
MVAVEYFFGVFKVNLANDREFFFLHPRTDSLFIFRCLGIIVRREHKFVLAFENDGGWQLSCFIAQMSNRNWICCDIKWYIINKMFVNIITKGCTRFASSIFASFTKLDFVSGVYKWIKATELSCCIAVNCAPVISCSSPLAFLVYSARAVTVRGPRYSTFRSPEKLFKSSVSQHSHKSSKL